MIEAWDRLKPAYLHNTIYVEREPNYRQQKVDVAVYIGNTGLRIIRTEFPVFKDPWGLHFTPEGYQPQYNMLFANPDPVKFGLVFSYGLQQIIEFVRSGDVTMQLGHEPRMLTGTTNILMLNFLRRLVGNDVLRQDPKDPQNPKSHGFTIYLSDLFASPRALHFINQQADECARQGYFMDPAKYYPKE